MNLYESFLATVATCVILYGAARLGFWVDRRWRRTGEFLFYGIIFLVLWAVLHTVARLESM